MKKDITKATELSFSNEQQGRLTVYHHPNGLVFMRVENDKEASKHIPWAIWNEAAAEYDSVPLLNEEGESNFEVDGTLHCAGGYIEYLFNLAVAAEEAGEREYATS